jgi:hypothetical protein
MNDHGSVESQSESPGKIFEVQRLSDQMMALYSIETTPVGA